MSSAAGADQNTEHAIVPLVANIVCAPIGLPRSGIRRRRCRSDCCGVNHTFSFLGLSCRCAGFATRATNRPAVPKKWTRPEPQRVWLWNKEPLWPVA
jgi:hypothetical protein